MFIDGFAFAFAGGFVGAPELVEKILVEIRSRHRLARLFSDTNIGTRGDAFDSDKLFEDLANFAVVKDLEFADVGNAVAELLGDLDNVAEILSFFEVFAAGKTKIFLSHVVASLNHLAANSIASETVGEVLKLVIDELADLHNGVI